MKYPIQSTLIVALAVCLAAPIAACSKASGRSQNAQIGIDPDATRIKLRDISTSLVTADKTGDAALAHAVVATLQPIQATMAQQPTVHAGVLRYCVLAARHLSAAATIVANGGRWASQDQFQTAAGACRA